MNETTQKIRKHLPFLKNPGRTLFRLLLASFAVGLLLSVFDIRPEELLRNLDENLREIFEAAVDLVRWAIPYILLGAVIVAPIWLGLTLLRALRRRESRRRAWADAGTPRPGLACSRSGVRLWAETAARPTTPCQTIPNLRYQRS